MLKAFFVVEFLFSSFTKGQHDDINVVVVMATDLAMRCF